METPSEKRTLSAPVGIGFWLRWVLANVAGFGGAGALFVAIAGYAPYDRYDWVDVILVGSWIAWRGFFLVGGLVGGVLQWLVLRCKLPQAEGWIWRSAVGTVVCIPISLVVAGLATLATLPQCPFPAFPSEGYLCSPGAPAGAVPVFVVVAGALSGWVFGALQRPALRREFSKKGAGIWVLVNMLGGAAGSGLVAGLTWAMMPLWMDEGPPILAGSILAQLGGGWAAGAVFGAITGLALARLLRQPADVRAALDERPRDRWLAVGVSVAVLLVTTVLMFGLAGYTVAGLARHILPPPATVPLAQMPPIAFASTRAVLDEIYVMDADGRHPTCLTSDPDMDMEPAWSPDGQRIVFTSGRDIYVMDANGRNLVNLTNDPAGDSAPAWAPRRP